LEAEALAFGWRRKMGQEKDDSKNALLKDIIDVFSGQHAFLPGA